MVKNASYYDDLYPGLYVTLRHARVPVWPKLRVAYPLDMPADPLRGRCWLCVAFWPDRSDGREVSPTPVLYWEDELRTADCPAEPPELPVWAAREGEREL